MAKTALYNMEGATIGEVELSDEIFAAPINEAAMHLVVRSYLAAQRQGQKDDSFHLCFYLAAKIMLSMPKSAIFT